MRQPPLARSRLVALITGCGPTNVRSVSAYSGPPLPKPDRVIVVDFAVSPDDVAYRLARALHRGEAALAQRLPQARETTAANTVRAAPRAELLHPGVLRYLREVGLVP